VSRWPRSKPSPTTGTPAYDLVITALGVTAADRAEVEIGNAQRGGVHETASRWRRRVQVTGTSSVRSDIA